MDTETRCPCGTGETYGNCCARFHEGLRATPPVLAPTPEAVMRSRFTAFAVGDADYLRATWHASTRPAELELDDSLRWYRLDIEEAIGGVFDSTGTVRFAAYYRSVPGVPEHQKVKGVQRENSRFVKENGAWFYVDGNVD